MTTEILTKRDLLLAIVEHPGTDPGASRQTHEWADELKNEGWIVEDLGGFRPTAKALAAHPAFTEQADIKDPDWDDAYADPAPGPESPRQELPLAHDRVTALFLVLADSHLPLAPLYSAMSLATQIELRDDAPETQIARKLTDLLLGVTQ